MLRKTLTLLVLDQDAVEEEDDEEEEEEEEEASAVQQHQGKRQHATFPNTGSTILRPRTPIHPPSPSAHASPVSTAPPQTPKDLPPAPELASVRSLWGTGKVKVIKQWTRDATWGTTKA